LNPLDPPCPSIARPWRLCFPLNLLSAVATVFLLICSQSHADEPIDSLLWEVTASDYSSNAPRAADLDASTRWDTGKSQAPGQWYQVDLGETRSISRVELDASGSSNDFPRRYEFSISDDGKNWTPVTSGEGKVITKIVCPTPKPCRYFRVTIAPDSPPEGAFWSIHELRAFASGSATGKTLPRPAPRWRVIAPTFPTRDTVIAGYDITQFGILPDKGMDATQAIKLATRLLARAGGGTLWLPAGHYRISEPLSLGRNVTLRGDWAAPVAGKPIGGTVLEMTANRNEPDGLPGISLSEAAAVVGVAFWYPEQKPEAIVPYPPTVKQFGGTGMALENVTFINAFRGFVCGPEGCALFFMRNLYGTVLDTGIEIDGTSDIGRMEHVRFSPAYWSGSGLPNSPVANGPHAQWMLEKGAGIVMRRNDWSYAYDVELEGYRYGFRALISKEYESLSKGWKTYPNGNNARFRFVRCRTAIDCENLSDVGMMFDDTDIVDADEGILAEQTFDSVLQLQNTRISAKSAAIRLLGKGQVLLTNCTVDGPVDNRTGYIGALGCTPAVPTLSGSAPGVGETRNLTGTAPATVKSPYTTPTDRFAAPTSRLAVVTDPSYGARGDARADDTAAVRKAMAAMAIGGGTVYFPAGEYRITTELVVPPGVELRGVNEGPHTAQTRGSVIDIATGRGKEDGPAFITLAAKSGLRGLTFHYPEQDALKVVPYPWMIRGAGAEVWVINVSCTFAYRMLDFATYRCDAHYIDYVGGHAFREAFRIGGGSVGGRLINCQLNPSYYSFTNGYANSPSRLNPKDPGRIMDATAEYGKAHADAYVIGDCTNQILFQNFVFGAAHGLVFTGSKTGASGWCLGHGSDACGWSVWVEKIGAMPVINTQLVTIDSFKQEHGYIGLSPRFTGVFSMIGVDAWGSPSNAIYVGGGTLSLTSAVLARSGQATVSLDGSGRAAIANAVVRNPDVVLQRVRTGDNARFSGVLLTGDSTRMVNSVSDLGDGLDLVRVPGSVIGVPFNAADALPTAGWKLKPSENAGDAALALDGKAETRWTTARPARKGDEVVVEMDREHPVTRVRVDAVASGNDYPRRFQVLLSRDGTKWSDPVITGRGEADLRVGFKTQPAKFIKIVNLADAGGFWSIHEIQVSEK
jgi:hypothetical protein